MSDLSVTERRIRPIQDAVSIRNWKQALQQCEKWQKKGESSDRFLALKASVLINQPDKSQFEKGRSEILQLCHRQPAVTDIEALHQLQDSLKHLSLLHEEGPKLLERAIAARPTDKELLTTLLNTSIRDDNWMSAQKAAMALRKAFPKERQYDFWNMLLCHLIHEDEFVPQKDRDLFGRLAFMLMSKAAEAVPKDADEVAPSGKAISTIEELALLIKIYKATGHGNDAAAIMQSPNLGPGSWVAELDPHFAFALFLEALSASDDEEEVFDACQRLLSPESPGFLQHIEDDRVWKTLKDTCTRSEGSRKRIEACQKIARATYEAEPKCRTAYLTYFDLAIEKARIAECDSESLAFTCAAYYKVFNEKPFCFSDLVHPLRATKDCHALFHSQLDPTNDGAVQQAFTLKLKYAELVAEREKRSKSMYLKLAKDAVRLHKQLPKGKSECPETALLAATILLDLAIEAQDDNFALQASFMMQNCYLKFSEYYPLAVRQVQLSLTQGRITQAMEKFGSLAVKNMQWETVGHLLLTRMSTIHPWQTGLGDKTLNPLAALDDGLVMLESADRTVEKAILEGLQYNSYSNVIDSVTVKGKMTRSINRQIFLVEERRIQRFVGVTSDVHLNPYPAKMIDQRDFSFLPTFGRDRTESELERYLSCGPLPKEFWLKAMAVHDHLVTYLRAELGSHAALAASSLDYLKTALDKSKTTGNEESLQLTPEEASSLACHQFLAEATLLTKESPSTAQQNFNALVDKVAEWLDDATKAEMPGTATINEIETPTWKYLHASFTTLEALRTISFFLGLQARRNKASKPGKAVVLIKDTLAELQGKVADVEKTVHKRARRLKEGIGASGVLGKLVDVAAGRLEDGGDEYKDLTEEYADLVDEVALEEYCGKMRDSWDEAIDGILKTKIKPVK